MPEETASSGTSATPTPETPATGTPASQGATPQKPATLTLEEAQARIAELERHASNKSEEAARHGKNLTAAEKELASYREKERLVQEAALSEAQKMEKRASEAEHRAEQYQQKFLNASVELAARAKDFINPAIAAKLVRDSLEIGEDGMPTNLEKALDDLAKHNPFLLHPKAPEASTPPAQTAQSPQAPAVPPMNPARNQGRSGISAPNSAPPGTVPAWGDILKRPY